MTESFAQNLLKEVQQLFDQGLGGEADLQAWPKRVQEIESAIKLPGDASTRVYYRLKTTQGKYVLMKTEPFEQEGADYLFLVVQKHLFECGVDVPKVFGMSPAHGLILLEDLGDDTLLHRLERVDDMQVEREIYTQVLDRLIRLQIYASPQKGGKDLPPFHLRFDYEKLMWEVSFTIEHFYKIHLNRTIQQKDQKVLQDGFGEICKILADQPTVFTHRDFHCRNIMCTDKEGTTAGRFVMIDFQDARMGPAQYDLVSLLKDSYYQLDESQIDYLLDYYIKAWNLETKASLDAAEFRRVFDLMAVQRNFKAIGSFASFLNRRKNATYLKYIGNTFENIRRVLLRYPRYSRLREVLFHYYYF